MEQGALSRREFVRKVGSFGALTTLLGVLPPWALAVDQRSSPRPEKNGPIDLTIDGFPLEVDGRVGSAVAINGSVPGPVVRLREGEEAVIRVTNRLSETASIHWHGLILPPDMDGVPGVSFAGIGPGETYTYRFPVRQSGTYWCHSHSGGQELLGVYAPLVIDPAGPEPFGYDRDYVVLLSDWSFESPAEIVGRLKKLASYYNFQKRTVADLARDVRGQGLSAAVRERLMWGAMNMDPTDIADVTGATYTYLTNGVPPSANWTGLFRPGERVRLRFIDAGAMTFFDVRDPGPPDDPRPGGRPERPAGGDRRVPHRARGDLRRDRRAVRRPGVHDLRRGHGPERVHAGNAGPAAGHDRADPGAAAPAAAVDGRHGDGRRGRPRRARQIARGFGGWRPLCVRTPRTPARRSRGRRQQ